MNYRKTRLEVDLSAYTIAKELGIDEKKYIEVEKGNLHLEGEKMSKFLDVIKRAKEINLNRTIKMSEIDEWIKSGQVLKDIEKTGYSQPEIADLLGYHYTYVNRAVKYHDQVSKDFKEKLYDFVTNPLNKKIEDKEVVKKETKKEAKKKQEPKQEVKEIVEPKEEPKEETVELIAVIPKEETVEVIDVPECQKIKEDPNAEIERLKETIKKLEKENKFLKIGLKRLFNL